MKTAPRRPLALPWLAWGLWLGTAGIAVAQDAPATAKDAARAAPEGLRFAHALLKDRRYDLAADQYQKFLTTSPAPSDAADAHFGLGRSRLFLGDYAAARREFEAYLDLAPDGLNAATARFRVGESAFLLNDFPAARAALEAYTRQAPEGTHRDSAWPLLGDACLKLNDPTAAKAAYLKALEVEPKGRLANRSRYYLGRALQSLGESAEAAKVLTALASAGDAEWSGRAKLLNAQVMLASGRAAEAAETFAELEREAPPGVIPAEARLRRAEALIALGNRDEAEALLAPLASEGAKLIAPPAAFALAGAWIEDGKFAEAQVACEGVIRRVPESPWVPRLLFRSAEALARQGKADEARARFLKVAAQYPRDAWAVPAQLRAARVALDQKEFPAAFDEASALVTPSASPANRADARLIAARAALGLGRNKDAIAALESLLADDRPGTEVAHSASYYLGLAYKADGQPEKARKLLGDLARSPDAPASADARLAVAFDHFEARRFAEAASEFQGYLDARPKSDDAAQALAYLALARSELKDEDAAKAALDRLAAEFPTFDALSRARVILGESALDAGRFDAAADQFRPVASSADPKWKPRALSGLGWAQLQGKHPEDAAASFALLLQATPDDPLAADAALGRGRALEEAGKIDESLAAYEFAAATYPKTEPGESARLARARLLAKSGKAVEAAEAFRVLAEAPPKGVTAEDVLVEQGWALHDAGRAADADAAFRKVLADHPDGPHAAEARVFLAESCVVLGKPDEAAALLAPVVADGAAADPTLIQDALLRLARLDLARGDSASASSRFDRLIANYPDGKHASEARFGKAESEWKAGRPEAAAPLFAAVAKSSDPKWSPAARVRQVQCLAALEKWDEALASADAIRSESVPLTPAQGAELDYCRGRALASQAPPRFDESRASYQAAIDAAPGTEVAARAQFMRGETYFHQKNYVEALREYHKTDLSYAWPEWQAAALLEAGKVYEQLGRWSEATDVYEKLLATFPKDARVEDARTRLQAAKARLAAPVSEGPAKDG